MIQRKTARELLAESFHDLARHKAVSKIRIREIAANCGYSPATFYRAFRDKADLVAWDYAQSVNRIMSQIRPSGFCWRDSLLAGARFYQEEQAYLVNLINHSTCGDSFENSVVEINFRNLKEYAAKQAALDATTELCLRQYCLGTVRLGCEWLTGKVAASAQEIAEVWEQSLPGILRPYLYFSERI